MNRSIKKRSQFEPIFDKISVICEPYGFEFVQNKAKIEQPVPTEGGSEIPTARRDKPKIGVIGEICGFDHLDIRGLIP